MGYRIQELKKELIGFVADVYDENREQLHGIKISLHDWISAFEENADPYEKNFIITFNAVPAAWLKINGIDTDKLYVSMLVVKQSMQHKGAGTFALNYIEKYAKENLINRIIIKTTQDNSAAIGLYTKLGYTVEKCIKYNAGGGDIVDGVVFTKAIMCN